MVVVTAHDSVSNAVEAMKLGAIDFLAKPITPDALRQVVAEVLARHPEDVPERDPAATRSNPRDTLSSAKRALNHRLFFRAEGLLKEAIKQRPDSAEPWYLLGILQEVQQKPLGGEGGLRWHALKIDPGYEPAKLHPAKFATR